MFVQCLAEVDEATTHPDAREHFLSSLARCLLKVQQQERQDSSALIHSSLFVQDLPEQTVFVLVLVRQEAKDTRHNVVRLIGVYRVDLLEKSGGRSKCAIYQPHRSLLQHVDVPRQAKDQEAAFSGLGP